MSTKNPSTRPARDTGKPATDKSHQNQQQQQGNDASKTGQQHQGGAHK